MSNEDNLFGIEDLDDTRVTSVGLQATPMSEPPRTKKKGKFKLTDVPREAYQFIKVFDRFGNEQKNVIEFDPESGNGKRLWEGNIENCYFHNGYIVADGQAHPDEEELPEIIDYIRYKQFHKEYTISKMDMLKTNPGAGIQTELRCPKCQSGIRFEEQDIVCTNGSCGTTWQQSGEGGGRTGGNAEGTPRASSKSSKVRSRR